MLSYLKFRPLSSGYFVIIHLKMGVEYSLTDTGWSLRPVLDSMVQWGNNYREMQK